MKNVSGLRVQPHFYKQSWIKRVLLVITAVLLSVAPYYHYSAIAAPILEAPTNLTPRDGTVVRGDYFTQTWQAVPGAARYEYQSYNDAAGQSLKFHSHYNGTEKTAFDIANVVFWWRVRAVGVDGSKGPWSQLWKLTIDNTKPTITTPTFSQQPGGITVTGTVTEPHLDTVTMRVDGEDIDSSAIDKVRGMAHNSSHRQTNSSSMSLNRSVSNHIFNCLI
jgi:hypothetical protein